MKLIIRATTVDKSLGFVEPFIEPLKKMYCIQLLSSDGDTLKSLCREYGLTGHPVYMYRRFSPFKDLKSLYEIINVFRRERPYIVHSMTPKAGLLCMLAAWITRVPKRVHTFTGLVWPTSTGVTKWILMLTDRITCACATHIIPEGIGVKNDLRLHITNKHMRVLGHGNIQGIDMIKYSRRPEVIELANQIRQGHDFTYIFVGRLVRDKGINELVSAFVTVNKEYPDCRLLLVGEYESDLDPLDRTTLETIRNNNNIHAVGQKSGDELLAYYAASDCFVFPSYREGFPNVVLEAGAMGLPSIVTDINGSNEIIEHNQNGIIIPSKDEKELYRAMKKVMIDDNARMSMSIKARPMVQSRFERNFVIQNLLNFYSEII